MNYNKYVLTTLLALMLTKYYSVYGSDEEQLRAAIEASKKEQHDREQRQIDALREEQAMLAAREASIRENQFRKQQREIELQAAIAASLHDSSSSAAVAHHYDDPEMQRAIEESMRSTTAHAHTEADDEEMRRAMELSLVLPSSSSAAAASYHDEEYDEETRAAIALSMQKPPAVAKSAIEIAREERLRRFENAQAARAPLSESEINAQVESTFESEKKQIENEIARLEAIDVNRTVTSAKDRPAKRAEVNQRLGQLRDQLQNYTVPGKITATKLRLKSYIQAQNH